MDRRIETVEIKASDIKHEFGNPRKITAKKKAELKHSLDTLGNFGVIVIDEDNNVIAGNQRLSILAEQDPDAVVTCRKLI